MIAMVRRFVIGGSLDTNPGGCFYIYVFCLLLVHYNVGGAEHSRGFSFHRLSFLVEICIYITGWVGVEGYGWGWGMYSSNNEYAHFGVSW